MAGEVLDQDASEALERAEHRAVQHYGRDLVRMLVDVERAEPAGQVEIDLHGAALPVAADGVAQCIVELRPVEGAFALVKRPWPPGSLERRHQRGLSLVPHSVVADPLRRSIGEPDRYIREAEVL